VKETILRWVRGRDEKLFTSKRVNGEVSDSSTLGMPLGLLKSTSEPERGKRASTIDFAVSHRAALEETTAVSARPRLDSRREGCTVNLAVKTRLCVGKCGASLHWLGSC
jgi:hypothetical protein